VQLPPGGASPGDVGQAILVHPDSFFKPLAGQVHVLQPSAAAYDRPGQHAS